MPASCATCRTALQFCQTAAPDHPLSATPHAPPPWTHPLTDEMLVWLASISPLTRCAVGMYGDLRERATYSGQVGLSGCGTASAPPPALTCILAGPHGMNWASFLSRIRCRLLCTCTHQGLASPNTSLWIRLQPLPYLCGVHLSLDNVQYGDVAVVERLFPRRRHHHVLGLQQPTHDI